MVTKPVKEIIHAKGFDIVIYSEDFKNEYISLTDIARYKSDEPKDVIKNWMRNKDTIEFLGLWEHLHNENCERTDHLTPLAIEVAASCFTDRCRTFGTVLHNLHRR